jgi:adenylylsulfate kinase-like enzyme
MSDSVPLMLRRSTRSEPPFLVTITGLPGSGKSTVAEEAADLLDATVLAHD